MNPMDLLEMIAARPMQALRILEGASPTFMKDVPPGVILWAVRHRLVIARPPFALRILCGVRATTLAAVPRGVLAPLLARADAGTRIELMRIAARLRS